jgi:hypothetical protein
MTLNFDGHLTKRAQYYPKPSSMDVYANALTALNSGKSLSKIIFFCADFQRCLSMRLKDVYLHRNLSKTKQFEFS